VDALRTIADHVLDVAQNSVNAGAKLINLQFLETNKDVLLKIEDDGKGMSKDIFLNVFDPFFTTQNKSKKFGLGLPFLKQNAELTGGYVNLESKEGVGTILRAKFIKNIDCPPIGDLAGTFASLVTSSVKVNWHILRCFKNDCYSFSTDGLEGVDLTSPQTIKSVFEYFESVESKIIQKSGGVDNAYNSRD
jgi:hypothetical protein